MGAEKKLIKARYEAHLGQSPTLPNGQAIIDFPPLIEKEPHQLWAAHFQIQGKQTRNRVAQMSFSIHMGCIISANVVRRFILYSLFPYFEVFVLLAKFMG